MKTELMHIPNKGLCIVISELDVKEIIQGLKGEVPFFGGGVFNDVYRIADEMRNGQKIPAIKEIRTQTGWGLKEAKQFCDKYMPMGAGNNFNYHAAADRFIKDHIPEDFLKDGDFDV
jgi:hypothetical protein